MGRQDTALGFVSRFWRGDVARLEVWLHAQLRLRGPFPEADSRAATPQAPAADPPEPAGFTVLSASEGEEDAAQFDESRGAARSAVMALLRRLREGRIAELLPGFDSRGFS